MTGSAIKGTSCAGLPFPYDLLVTDTSKLIFEGTSFFACLRLQDTAEANIDTDILYTNGSSDNGVGILVEDDAVATVKVNTRELYFNTATAAEYAAGAYSANSFRLKDNANFQVVQVWFVYLKI
jgi:hypothetical protein